MDDGRDFSVNILSIDVGGTHIKALANGQSEVRKVESGPSMTAAMMVEAVKRMTADWSYDVVSIGYPGPVVHGAPVKEPANLAPGWVGFDFAAGLGRPVRIINDAAMQALGSDQGGRMLFLGLGTGLGSAMVVNGRVEPLELAHLPYKRKRSYEDVVGLRGLRRIGKKKWRREVSVVIAQLANALEPDYVVIGGGNAKLLAELPSNARLGDNANAFLGGFRLWADSASADQAWTGAERRIVDSPEEIVLAAAAEFYLQAISAVGNAGVFRVALSGGSTPRGLYELLASDPTWRTHIPWYRTHVFWGDERHVPPDHTDSNFRSANDGFLASVPMPQANIHRVHGEMPDAAEAAADYERELGDQFRLAKGELPRFDLIVLGLGEDGHTASLFPGTRALWEKQHLVVSHRVDQVAGDRITLTAPVLNNAACIMFMVSGVHKARALAATLEGPHEPDHWPAQMIKPTRGRLIWLLDRAAAQGLSAPNRG